uniref:Coiled-coil domain-containing protein 98 n=1 Tax=Anabas testudineus TaxID=64144 RepID=A0A7N5ZQZ4_ANATE
EEQITISDSQADHIHIEETYSTFVHLQTSRVDLICSKLQQRLSCFSVTQESVIGWYRQRRNTDQQMTFREKIVHENLKSALSNPHIIFVLLTPSKLTPPGSTHRMEYAAFISRSREFMNVPVLVNNLGLLEQLAYWKVSAPLHFTCLSAAVTLTICCCRSKFFSSNGLLREVNEVNKMNETLQSELQKACRNVEESERLVETLQAEVSTLRRRVREKKRSKAAGDADGGRLEQQKNNPRLHEAVRVLFACSSLFHTQTLTLDAFPVADGCCCNSEQDEHTMQKNSDTLNTQETLSLLNPCRANCRKRLNETLPERESKRRKSKS